MDIESIDKQILEIQNGTRDIPQFNQPEHAGVCSAGPLLIGALIVCYNARESLTASCNVAGSQRTGSRCSTIEQTAPANWQIDEEQERQLQQWAEAKHVWFPQSEEWITASYGPRIAEGAEAKVFYKTGDTSVIKLRTSIYGNCPISTS